MKRNKENLALYKEFCMKIWRERGFHKGKPCPECGNPVGHWDEDLGEFVPSYHNMAHGEKGRRLKKDCLDPNNVKIKCYVCHSVKDHKLSVTNAEWLR